MKKQNCLNCSFSSWYSNFKSITFKSYIIKLPTEFIKYLNEDGIVLPDDDDVKYQNHLSDYSDNEDSHWEHHGTDNEAEPPQFPELKAEVSDIIKKLGNSCFVKLNWSSPKDAAWMSRDGTLRCSSFNDICLLLKSSDFVTHDVSMPFEYCEDDTSSLSLGQYELVLRQFVDIVPGMEFRCFVKENKLFAISQRHHMTFFDYLLQEKDLIKSDILNFYNGEIKGKFADKDFVFDVYRTKNGRIRLVDFNVFGRLTDSLLFDWDELNECDIENTESLPYFRIITSGDGIQPGPYMSYGVPVDTIDLSTGEDIHKMIDFLNVKNLIRKPGEDSD